MTGLTSSVALAANMSEFATRLYMNLNSDDSLVQSSNELQNVVLSPLSVETALALLFCGAGGHTSKVLQRSLRLGHSRKTVANEFHQLLSKLQDAKIANAIFIQKGYVLQPEFKDIAQNKFYSALKIVNFENALTATSVINSWVAQETNNEIPHLYSADSIQSMDSALVLANVIYFKGKWKTQFKTGDTTASGFKTGDCQLSTYSQVEMMHTSVNYGNFVLKFTH